ncbi:MAG: hypothetical protein R3B47_11295 [Bacteroidia bacterium]
MALERLSDYEIEEGETLNGTLVLSNNSDKLLYTTFLAIEPNTRITALREQAIAVEPGERIEVQDLDLDQYREVLWFKFLTSTSPFSAESWLQPAL